MKQRKCNRYLCADSLLKRLNCGNAITPFLTSMPTPLLILVISEKEEHQEQHETTRHLSTNSLLRTKEYLERLRQVATSAPLREERNRRTPRTHPSCLRRLPSHFPLIMGVRLCNLYPVSSSSTCSTWEALATLVVRLC